MRARLWEQNTQVHLEFLNEIHNDYVDEYNVERLTVARDRLGYTDSGWHSDRRVVQWQVGQIP